jgi:hypothetical protein
MALITKQSVIDIYNTRVRDNGLAAFTVDSGSNPGSTRIKTAKLGPGTFPQPGTAQLNTTLIDGSNINTVFYEYARYLSTIRPIRHGYIVDNFSPNTAETTTDDTNTNADLIDSEYKNNSAVPSTIASRPQATQTVDLSDLQGFADDVWGSLVSAFNSYSRVDLRVCHGSCHSSCHGSRGRR